MSGGVEAHLSALPAHDGERIAAVAWTQAATGSLVTLKSLTVRDSTGHGAASVGFDIDQPLTGKIDPHSVRLRGLRVSFDEGRRHRSFKLRA